MKKNILFALGTLCFSASFILKVLYKSLKSSKKPITDSKESASINVIDFDSFKDIKEEQKRNKSKRKKPGRLGRRICVYSARGRFLRSYKNVTEASRKESISYHTIIKCAQGEHLALKNTTNIYLYESENIYERLRKIRENAFYYPHVIEAMKSTGYERGPENLLKYIPTDKDGIFTYEDYIDKRKDGGFREESAKSTLRKWKQRGYVKFLEDGRFQKLRKSDIRVLIDTPKADDYEQTEILSS